MAERSAKPQPDPPQRDAAFREKRARIQEAAMRVFSGKGFGKATMPDIAREAGVAVGTIYIYFRTKQEILLSIMESHLLVEPLRQFFGLAEEMDDRDLLSGLVEACLRFGHDNAREFIFLLSEILRDPYIRKMYAKRSLGPALELVEGYLSKRVEEGVFGSQLDLKAASRALAGMVVGMVILYGIEFERGKLGDQAASASSQAVRLVLEGLEIRDAKERREGKTGKKMRSGGAA